MPSLRELHMSDMENLTLIASGAMSKLTGLQELYLSHNPRLSSIHPDTFSSHRDGEESEEWPLIRKVSNIWHFLKCWLLCVLNVLLFPPYTTAPCCLFCQKLPHNCWSLYHPLTFPPGWVILWQSLLNFHLFSHKHSSCICGHSFPLLFCICYLTWSLHLVLGLPGGPLFIIFTS